MNKPVALIAKAFLLVLLVALATFAISAQTGAEVPKLVEVVEHPNCEYLLMQLDRFPLQLDERNVGHIVLFGGRDPIQNVAYEKYLKRHLIGRRLDPSRVRMITGPSGQKLRIEFWVSPVGQAPGVEATVLTRQLENGNQPISFDGDLYERSVDAGKISFVGYGCAACCITSMDWSTLNEFLSANPRTIAYVVIRGRRSRAVQLRSYLAQEIRESEIPSKRVVYLFAKKNSVNSRRFNEVEVFISRSRIKTAAAFKTRAFVAGSMGLTQSNAGPNGATIAELKQ